MNRDVDALESGEFDVLVIGGGINGTGVARDAARRGLRVALVEKEDFGYGTTGRSTRLIHGGLRYLEMYDFGLVRESLRERRLLLKNAPHLVRPLPFLFPLYKGGPSRSKIRLGLALYDRLASDRDLPGHRWLPRDELLELEPGLNADGLLGAFEYHDAQIAAVERLCVENALDAAAHGAVVANHCEVGAFLRDDDGRVTGARCVDRLTGRTIEARARVTFNATGPWLSVLDVATSARPAPRVRMTKGIHLIVPHASENALILRAPTDGRTFFSIPWFGNTLVGTTDTDFAGDLDDVHADAPDVRYLIESTKKMLPGAPVDDVAYTTAGIRPLLNVEGVPESQVSRKHDVIDHEKEDGVPGIVTLLGGKITPFRGVCEEVTDKLTRKMGLKKLRSDTRDAALPGGDFTDLGALYDEAIAAAADAGIPERSARHLVDLYGTRYVEVLDLARADPSLAEPLCPHTMDVAAEVAHAVEREMAVTARDVLLRRTTAGWMPCEARDAALETTLRIMRERLQWSDARVDDERRAYVAELAKRHRHESAAESAATPAPEGARA